MEKFIEYIKKHFLVILVCIMCLSSINQCAEKQEINKIKKELIILNDSLYQKKSVDLKMEQLKLLSTIEGLKAEKRMIQATDRKILDVNRQNEIDKELSILEKKLKENETLDK